MHALAAEVFRETAELLTPPRRMRPSEAAAKFLRNDRGAWSPDLAPMMIEPLDMLASRDYRGVVFVGPARTGKTFGLIHGGLAYAISCGMGDSLVVQMSQNAAHDFSRSEVERVLRYSPELEARMSPRPRDDGIYQKHTKAGAAITIGWPVIGHVSSKTLQHVLLTDYDRAQDRDDVGGEGPLWDLALKRTETYMSRGSCLAESSPGEDYALPDWRGTTPHEAPPSRGILSLYNSGTRAWWYWPCKHCGETFAAAPGLAPFALPDFDDLLAAAATGDLHTLAEQYAKVPCTHCGGLHEMADKPAMNRGGHWIHEGDTEGKGRRRSPVASYWLGGVAAAYQRWDAMLYRYLSAVQTFGKTGDESSLRAVTNTDFGTAYLPRAIARRRSGAQLRKRAEAWPQGLLPEGVRFLTAAIDVQSHAFVVQIQGWGIGLESWLIDRYSITSSLRAEGDRTAAVDPGGYAEDWDLLKSVMDRSYAFADVPDIKIKPILTVCDSGGREGVTARAYEFWRSLRVSGLARRFFLVKGTGAPQAPRIKRTFPDATRRSDRRQGGRGDVPVWLLNSNLLKDAIANDLAREKSGPGYLHLPNWLPSSVFDELTSETRTAKGWVKSGGVRNEGLDLAAYNRAAVIICRAESINWDRPPKWACLPSATPVTEAPEPVPVTGAPPRINPFPRIPVRAGWVRRW